VPIFREKEVDKYFQHFEKVADSLKWPKEYWTMLLQSSFVGKAREIYSSLPVEKCNDYDEVKKAVLKAYELVPEAYRQKFRNSRLKPEQTHVEFARGKEQMFDKWLGSKEIKDDFGQLRQLILVEEFKNCVHADIKTHLDENANKIAKTGVLPLSLVITNLITVTMVIMTKSHRQLKVVKVQVILEAQRANQNLVMVLIENR